MGKKIEIGDYFFYKYEYELFGEEFSFLIGRIIGKTERGYEYEMGKQSNGLGKILAYRKNTKISSFDINSDMYNKCIIGKSLDELWVRMI